jgi:hypothetical protein
MCGQDFGKAECRTQADDVRQDEHAPNQPAATADGGRLASSIEDGERAFADGGTDLVVEGGTRNE